MSVYGVFIYLRLFFRFNNPGHHGCRKYAAHFNQNLFTVYQFHSLSAAFTKLVPTSHRESLKQTCAHSSTFCNHLKRDIFSHTTPAPPPSPFSMNEHFPRQANTLMGLANQVKMQGTNSWTNCQVTLKVSPPLLRRLNPDSNTSGTGLLVHQEVI